MNEKIFGTCYTAMRNHFEITGELDKIPTKLQKKKKSQSIDISFQFLLVLAR